jgi:hypothetical protein
MAKGELMNKIQKIIFTVLVIAGIGVLFSTPFLATPVNAQIYYYTPTASANGNIYYTVREGETCESISALTLVDLNVLRELNKLGLDDCNVLQVGQTLILGVVPTAAATVGPSPTPTGGIPTPLPPTGFGTICVYLYDDINGNAMAEPNETTDTGLAGGEISISNQAGDFTRTGTTINNGDAICYEDAPEGDYTISIAIPDGYNPTAAQNNTIHLKAGDTATVNFSAQVSSSPPPGGETSGNNNSNLFLAVIGGVIVISGIGLGLYARFIRRK